MSFRTPQEVKQAQEMYEKFKTYIIPTIVYDEYLKKFDFEYEPDDFDANFLDSIDLRFNSFEEVYSKKRKRKVIIDFYLSYCFSQPPDWMKTQISTSKNKGEANAYIWVFDADSRQRLEVEYLAAAPLPQFLETLKNYLRNDLSFDQDGGPSKQPDLPPKTPVESPVDQELIHAWVQNHCKFTKS